MKILFYGNRQGNIEDKAIRWWTSNCFSDKLNGRWMDGFSHVEIEFSDRMMFSSSPREGKVRFKKRNPKSTAWVEKNMIIPPHKEYAIRKLCMGFVGREYDYKGIAGFVFHNDDDKNKWFCSELILHILQILKIIDSKYIPSQTSPNKLSLIIENEYKGQDIVIMSKLQSNS